MTAQNAREHADRTATPILLHSLATIAGVAATTFCGFPMPGSLTGVFRRESRRGIAHRSRPGSLRG